MEDLRTTIINTKLELSNVKSEITKLRAKEKTLYNKLTRLAADCPHSWDLNITPQKQYGAIVINATRRCSICGKEQSTNNTEIVQQSNGSYTVEPIFK